jgi:hypothetical protein
VSVLATYEVFNNESNALRQLDVVDNVDDTQISFVEREWAPRLADSRARAVIALRALAAGEQTNDAWQNKQAQFGAPDSHWIWRDIRQSTLGSVHRMVGVLDGDVVEALMRLDLSKPSRLLPATYTPIVYVDYLAVAPWNRAPIQNPARYRGLGKLLLGVAVSISMTEGMEGRCGLHSLVQSEGFYVRAGMTDLGMDLAAELRYFEFSADAAKTFVET